MAVIKVFDAVGVKTVKILDNVTLQDYDPIEEEDTLSEPTSEPEEES